MAGCLVNRELTTNSIVAGLFAEGLVPNGSVLDAGANDGSWACMYGCLDGRRTVIGVEPVAALLKPCGRPNVRLRVAALSNRTGSVPAPIGFQRHAHAGPLPSGGAVEVTTVDTVFARDRAGFLHLDVEQHEIRTLDGARRVLQMDRPLLQVEAMQPARDLMSLLGGYSYVFFAVRESCGTRDGCRNLLCLPSELMPAARQSPTLTLAARSDALHRVHSPEDLAKNVRLCPVRPWATDCRGHPYCRPEEL